MSEQTAPQAAASEISRSRLEFLFDGIFAIAMTILVLELKVPELADRHSVGEMARDLAHHGATFFSYLFSFLILGLLWYRHNLLYRNFVHITPGMLALHLVQLAAAAFFPFCAAVFGRYPTNDFSVVVYSGCLLVFQWASLGAWALAERAGAIQPELGAEGLRRLRKRSIRGALVISVLFLFFVAKVLAR